MQSPQPEATAALAQAGTALWLATLSLMTAFMKMRAPAHRLLLARRIARNFATLREQECFDTRARDSFSRLADHWDRKAGELSNEPAPRSAAVQWLQRLIGR